MKASILVSAVIGAGAASAAHAGVITFYDVFKTMQRVQLNDTTVSPILTWHFAARVFTNEAFTIDGAEVSYTGPHSSFALDTVDGSNFVSSFSYWTQPELNSAFPNSAYTFTIHGGMHDSQTATLEIAGDMYPSQAPMLTGGSYATLQSIDALVGYTGHMSSWSPPTEADYGLTYVLVSDAATSELVHLTVAGPTETVVSIPGGLLDPEHAYRLDLVYSARIARVNYSLDKAFGVIGFDARTYMVFTTLPAPTCAGDVNGNGRTNTADFNILAINFNTGPGASFSQGDLNGDGFVNVADFNIMAGDFACPFN